MLTESMGKSLRTKRAMMITAAIPSLLALFAFRGDKVQIKSTASHFCSSHVYSDLMCLTVVLLLVNIIRHV